jgi:hypothetical protein
VNVYEIYGNFDFREWFCGFMVWEIFAPSSPCSGPRLDINTTPFNELPPFLIFEISRIFSPLLCCYK